MKLKKLIKALPEVVIKGARDLEITGICNQSKRVAPGNLFIAKKGRRSDGAGFIPDALSAGASAILTDIYDPTLKGAVQIIHPDVAFCEAKLAAAFFGDPSRELFTVGVTGTNGKTTVAHLVRQLLHAEGLLCGMIGTVGYIVGDQTYAAEHTTPDVVAGQRLLRKMVQSGCKAAAMEVSSHALDQGRVEGIAFDAAVFTNLSPEHLDYHGTMERYAEAKGRLFKQKVGKAVVNADSSWHQNILEGCQAEVFRYGIEAPADLTAKEIRYGDSSTTFTLHYRGEQAPVATPFVGKHNVYNCLAAFGVSLSRGVGLKFLQEKAPALPQVPGRLERVPNARGLKIFVDYAHTPDALENVLGALKGLTSGRIIAVFGCGGDRDREKRPKMAEAVERAGAHAIVTSDNPRSENPEQIIREVASGFSASASFETEPDRREAIARAISLAAPNDLILIAGKGHETRQIFAFRTVEFDDRKVAAEICGEPCCV